LDQPPEVTPNFEHTLLFARLACWTDSLKELSWTAGLSRLAAALISSTRRFMKELPGLTRIR
jgi:hypothetical protein